MPTYTEVQVIEATSAEQLNALVAAAIAQGKTPIGKPTIAQAENSTARHFTQSVGVPEEEGGADNEFVLTAGYSDAYLDGDAFGFSSDPSFPIIGTATANPGDRCTAFIYYPPTHPFGELIGVSIDQREGASAYVDAQINGGAVFQIPLAEQGAGWSGAFLPPETIPVIDEGDTITFTLYES